MLRRSCERRAREWFLEHAGVRLARLTEPNFAEMFWVQYRVTPMPGVSWETLANSDLWVASDTVRFRNASTGDVAPDAFQGGRLPSSEWQFVVMRALYVEHQPLWLRAYEWTDEHWPSHPFGLFVLLLALARLVARVVARRAAKLFRLTIVE
jgi:hypothetical protein